MDLLFAFWVLVAVWTWYDARRSSRQDRLAAYIILGIALVATFWQSVFPPLPSMSHAVVSGTMAVMYLFSP